MLHVITLKRLVKYVFTLGNAVMPSDLSKLTYALL